MPRGALSPFSWQGALLAIVVWLPASAQGETQSEPAVPESAQVTNENDTAIRGKAFADIGAYFTAPLHWSTGEWEIFAGVLASIGAAHHFDSQVRSHFVNGLSPTQISDTKDFQDAIPTAAMFVGTLAYANLIDSRSGRLETWTMFEAAVLSGVTTYALKYAVDREGPYQTNDPNAFHRSGSSGSFPSVHATAAFAVGTVLAESGSDDYRWMRRFIGYGLGLATDYERLKHNAHWLSDVVAGSALGAASASFSMNRVYHVDADTGFMLVPVSGGVMLTYRTTLP
jgi:membrane-associated phospholipid phosphatase